MMSRAAQKIMGMSNIPSFTGETSNSTILDDVRQAESRCGVSTKGLDIFIGSIVLSVLDTKNNAGQC